MFKPPTKRSQSPHTSSQSNIPSHYQHNPSFLPVQSSSKIDLRKFNEYLEDRIRQKGLKKCTDHTLKQEDLFKKQQYRNNHQKMHEKDSASKDHSVQKYRESLNQRRGEIISVNGSWKKHESIERLLQKQITVLNDESHDFVQCQSNQSSLCLLERKYQELQEKYKQLMVQAISSAKHYESDKFELKKVKDDQIQDKKILSELRQQLLSLQNSTSISNNPKTTAKLNSKCKSQQFIQSQNFIPRNEIPPACVEQMWRNREREEKRTEKQSQMSANKSNRTCEAWFNKMQKGSVYRSQQKVNRNFSGEKMLQSSRKGVRSKKLSEDCIYVNIESKTSIKLIQSLKGSKVRPSMKQLPKNQCQPLKCITPTTLHKKMINSNLYSKYRFQPSLKLP